MSNAERLTHINSDGEVNMVDVGDKKIQQRIAIAKGKINLRPATIRLIEENNVSKGDVITVAKIAGIQAAKNTATLIPLCHTLALTKVELKMNIHKDRIEVESYVRCSGKTGVEMEALTATSVALLTIYDMCKAVDKEMVISDVRLIKKEKK